MHIDDPTAHPLREKVEAVAKRLFDFANGAPMNTSAGWLQGRMKQQAGDLRSIAALLPSGERGEAEDPSKWERANDGPHKPSMTRIFLARWAADSSMTEDEALDAIAHHPAISDRLRASISPRGEG
jgi:hypothetical protein